MEVELKVLNALLTGLRNMLTISFAERYDQPPRGILYMTLNSIMLKFWRVKSTPSLLSLPGTL